MSPDLPYPSQRQPVLARNVVATSQPLAVAAGLEMLRRGGTAADAAIAMAATLTIVEPTSNGIGGDCFAIVHTPGGLWAMNASGRSPAGWTRDRFPADGPMPLDGPDSVTVPGQVAGWRLLHETHGSLPFADLLAPAIAYAEDGYAVSPITAAAWQRAAERFGRFEEWRRVFMPAPVAGDVVKLPDHAETLRQIAEDCGERFYRGPLAERIAAAAGHMTPGDLAAHTADVVEPIGVDYRDHVLHEIPPSGQGLAALLALGMLRHHELPGEPDDPRTLHLQIEATKLALADAHAHIADVAAMKVGVGELLADAYLERRAALIDPATARDAAAGEPRQGGTVYLCAAAGDMSVSFIQSNFFGFGSGVVVPGTGIALQNRGRGFVTTPGHPNEVGPGKRPFHTIIPGLLTKDGDPALTFGVMGGPMQAQGHLQMVSRYVDFGQNPQAASDAPRWQVMPDLGPRVVWVEPAMPAATVAALEVMGHVIEIKPPEHFGGAQLIAHLPGGVRCAASDPRKDGHAAGF